jgi:hypothetical protein
VLLLDVVEPRLILRLKLESIQAANEAALLDIRLQLIPAISHIRKGVDNDSENQVQQENNDQAEEGQVKEVPDPESPL